LFNLERDREGKGRVEEEEEDSGSRSILGLGQIALRPEPRDHSSERDGRREVPPPLGPAPEPDDQANSGSAGSPLGLDRIVRSSQWKAAVARHVPPPGASREPEEPESSGSGESLLGLGRMVRSSQWKEAVASHVPARPSGQDREPDDTAGGGSGGSLLGLGQLVRSAQWKAAVASHAPPLPVAPIRERQAAQDVFLARRDDEDAHDGALFALERSEFALRSRPVAPSGGSPPAGQAPSAVSAAPGPKLRAAESRNPLLARDLLSLRDPFDAEIEPPQFERELRPETVTPIPVERAVFLSLIAHVLLLLLLLWAPMGTPGTHRGFLEQLYPAPKPDDKIPLVFRSAPGPERENPKRSDLSDKSRRAGGGDRSRPKADTPYVPPNRGVEGLAPGQNRTARAAPPPPPPAAARPAEKAASGAAGEQAKPAEDGFRVPPPGAAASGEATQNPANLQQAIQDAARQIGARGQGGAGYPNPDGGFVDSGPISFDTSWYDWGPYAEEMIRRIKLHWEIPELARLGWKGRLTVRFYILANGTVEGAQYLSHSGTPPFDFAAFNAILKSSPFRPLPKDLLEQIPGKDREGITVTFFYNIRPEDERK